MSEKTIFIVNAALTASRAGLDRIPAPVTGTLDEVHLLSDNAMSGGDALFDVNKNGATIWSDQTQRAKIEDGDTAGSKTGLAIAVTQFTDFISVDFDEFTGTAASVGGKLYILLIFNEPGGGAGTLAGAKVGLTLDQAISNDVDNPAGAIEWDAGLGDDGGFFSIVDGQIKIPEGTPTRWYQIVAQVTWQGNAAGARKIEIAVDSGGGPVVVARKYEGGLGTTHKHYMQIATLEFLDAGNIVYVLAWQNSGGSLSVIASVTEDDLPIFESWVAITPAGEL